MSVLRGEVVEQALEDGVQPAGADVFGLVVDDGGVAGDLADGVVVEGEGDAFGAEEGDVLCRESVLGLAQDSLEIVLGERFELDADREAALQSGMRSRASTLKGAAAMRGCGRSSQAVFVLTVVPSTLGRGRARPRGDVGRAGVLTAGDLVISSRRPYRSAPTVDCFACHFCWSTSFRLLLDRISRRPERIFFSSTGRPKMPGSCPSF